jgi:hypothetical protein
VAYIHYSHVYHVFRRKKCCTEKTQLSHTSATIWRKNQPVKHEKYGIGTIQETEEKSNGATHITVRFLEQMLKKLLHNFCSEYNNK